MGYLAVALRRASEPCPGTVCKLARSSSCTGATGGDWQVNITITQPAVTSQLLWQPSLRFIKWYTTYRILQVLHSDLTDELSALLLLLLFQS